MSLKLLVDEDSQGRLLVKLLRQAGHDVQTAAEAGLSGKSDKAVLEHAVSAERVIVTGNCNDFLALSARVLKKGGHHYGIMLIHKFNNPSKDLSALKVAAAIGNIELTGVALNDQVLVVNHFQYKTDSM